MPCQKSGISGNLCAMGPCIVTDHDNGTAGCSCKVTNRQCISGDMKADTFHKCHRADIRHLRTVEARDTQCLVVGYLCDDAVGFQQFSIAFNSVKYFGEWGARVTREEANTAL